MRLPKGKPTGVFFVDVLSQHSADGRRRILPMNPRQEDRKVSNIDCMLLLKMDEELGLARRALSKSRPCPMVLAIHDAKNLFLEAILWPRSCHCLLPSLTGAS